MVCYLVVYQADLDDVPVKMFDQLDEAEAFAEELECHYEDDDCDHHVCVTRSLQVMGRDVGTFQGVAVAKFDGGELVSWDVTTDDDE